MSTTFATSVAPTVTPDELETWPTIQDDLYKKSDDPYKESVVHEAARLDRLLPDWYERIDISELTMWSCNRCILGQAYAPQDFMSSYTMVIRDSVARNEPIYGAAYASSQCRPHWINEIEARRK